MEIGQKLLFYNCRSIGWLIEYRIVEGSRLLGLYMLLLFILWDFGIVPIVVVLLALLVSSIFGIT